MSAAATVVLVIDGLSPRFLGPYGNSWIPTPCFNQLASQAATFENGMAVSTDLTAAYDAYWSADLLNQSQSADLQRILITDEPQVAAHPAAEQFDAAYLLEMPAAATAADDIDDCYLANFFSAVINQWQDLDCTGPYLLWIHARGFTAAWDAPYEMRLQFCDEDDPPPPQSIEPPCGSLADSVVNDLNDQSVADDTSHDDVDEQAETRQVIDPLDLQLGWQQAYAAQLQVLDDCLGWALPELEARLATIFPSLDAEPDSEPNDPISPGQLPPDQISLDQPVTLLLTSPRGYALGEHGLAGPTAADYYQESLHVPLWIYAPQVDWPASRYSRLWQPTDLAQLLLALSTATGESDEAGNHLDAFADNQLSARNTGYADSNDQSQQAVRTPAWFIRVQSAETQLFAKPDDLWDMNDIAVRCPDVVEQLTALLASRIAWQELSDVLEHGFDA